MAVQASQAVLSVSGQLIHASRLPYRKPAELYFLQNTNTSGGAQRRRLPIS